MPPARKLNSRGNERLDWPPLSEQERTKLLRYLDNAIEAASRARSKLTAAVGDHAPYELERQREYWKNVRSGLRWLRNMVEPKT